MFRKLGFLWLLLVTTGAQAGQNVVIVLDDSGSMSWPMGNNSRLNKMQAAKNALLKVVDKLPADTKVGIVLLNGGWGSRRWVYPLATVDVPTIKKGIQAIDAGGGTPLGARMKEGCDALLALRAKEHYGSYRLLIVTDGEATDAELVERYLPDILARGVWVDVIGVDMASDHSLATRVHSYRGADDLRALEAEIARVLMPEPTADAMDAGESDFEVIASIPEELAAAALEALSESGNHPIGEAPPLPPDAPPGVAPAAQQGPVMPGQPAGGVASTATWAGLLCVIFLGGIGLLVVVFVLMAVSKKPKRF